MAEYTKKSISEMKLNDKIESIFSVHYTKPVTEYRYGSMFEFRVADRTGQITVKYWGGESQKEVLDLYDSLSRDAVVRIRGTVGEYRGQRELAVNPKDGGMIEIMADGEYDVRELIAARDDLDELRVKFNGYIAGVMDTHLSALLGAVFGDEEFMAEFSECPASIMLHSSEIGGLLYHTLNVADICMLAWDHYREMDRDLLLSGALLHDVGKVRTFRVTTNINQTEAGIFLGHLVMGMTFVESKIDTIADFPEEKRNKLLHIMLSHHGRKDWGSPVEPAIPEALTVHFADDFDAKLYYMIDRRGDASTDDNWIWDNRFKRHIYLG